MTAEEKINMIEVLIKACEGYLDGLTPYDKEIAKSTAYEHIKEVVEGQ